MVAPLIDKKVAAAIALAKSLGRTGPWRFHRTLEPVVASMQSEAAKVAQGRRLAMADFCSGVGGFRLAGDLMGMRCVASCELNPKARMTYRANFGGDIFEDVLTLAKDPAALPDFDIMAAGFPCQGNSVSGKRLGLDDPRFQPFLALMRILAVKRPRWAVLENVPGLAMEHCRETMAAVMAALDKAGYLVQTFELNSADFGCAQDRRRLFFVCRRKGISASVGEPKPWPRRARFDSISDEFSATLPFIQTFAPSFVRLTDDIFGQVWDRCLLNGNLSICNVGHVGNGSQGDKIFHSWGLAKTHTNGGCWWTGGGYMVLSPGGWIRGQTPLEIQRLMGFPENFVWPVNDSLRFSQLGNAVAMPVAMAVFLEVLRADAACGLQPGHPSRSPPDGPQPGTDVAKKPQPATAGVFYFRQPAFGSGIVRSLRRSMSGRLAAHAASTESKCFRLDVSTDRAGCRTLPSVMYR